MPLSVTWWQKEEQSDQDTLQVIYQESLKNIKPKFQDTALNLEAKGWILEKKVKHINAKLN